MSSTLILLFTEQRHSILIMDFVLLQSLVGKQRIDFNFYETEFSSYHWNVIASEWMTDMHTKLELWKAQD